MVTDNAHRRIVDTDLCDGIAVEVETRHTQIVIASRNWEFNTSQRIVKRAVKEMACQCDIVRKIVIDYNSCLLDSASTSDNTSNPQVGFRELQSVGWAFRTRICSADFRTTEGDACAYGLTGLRQGCLVDE